MPPQITTKIRQAATADSGALGLITVSASLHSFIGRIPEERLDLGWRPQDSAAGWRAMLEKLPVDQFVLVAEHEGRVAGFVWSGLSDAADQGQIKGLYVLPSLHGKGIGRELLAHAVDRLEKQDSITSLLIGCIRENPSCGFYRHLGGVEAFRRSATVDDFRTEEIFFSWSDLSPLRHAQDNRSIRLQFRPGTT